MAYDYTMRTHVHVHVFKRMHVAMCCNVQMLILWPSIICVYWCNSVDNMVLVQWWMLHLVGSYHPLCNVWQTNLATYMQALLRTLRAMLHVLYVSWCHFVCVCWYSLCDVCVFGVYVFVDVFVNVCVFVCVYVVMSLCLPPVRERIERLEVISERERDRGSADNTAEMANTSTNLEPPQIVIPQKISKIKNCEHYYMSHTCSFELHVRVCSNF